MKRITKDLPSPRESAEKTNELGDLLPLLYVEDNETNFDIAEVFSPLSFGSPGPSRLMRLAFI